LPPGDRREGCHPLVAKSAGDDRIEPGQIRVAVEREPVQADAGSKEADADRADLIVSRPDAGLDVGSRAQFDADALSRPDDGRLDPAQMLTGVGVSPEI